MPNVARLLTAIALTVATSSVHAVTHNVIADTTCAQLISNDPGGDRWIRLIDDAVEMFYEHMTNKAKQSPKGRRTR